MKLKPIDIRTLCYRCASDMTNAKIIIKRTGGKRSRCDKCNRPGSNYIVQPIKKPAHE